MLMTLTLSLTDKACEAAGLQVGSTVTGTYDIAAYYHGALHVFEDGDDEDTVCDTCFHTADECKLTAEKVALYQTAFKNLVAYGDSVAAYRFPAGKVENK
jgi:hypothetical protein